jgi:hypothetical protein
MLRPSLVAAKPAGGAGPYTQGPLDIVAAAVFVAYGQRALAIANLGSALYTIERDSDSTTQSFDSDLVTGDAPVAAIASFIGAGNGLVTTWNDQSGNGIDLTNLDNTLAALGWNVINASARPGIGNSPQGGFGYLQSANTAAWTSAAPLTAFAVVYIDSADTAGVGSLLSIGSPTTPANWVFVGSARILNFEMNDASNNFQEWDAPGSNFSGLHIFEALVDASGNVTLLQDGTDVNAVSEGGPNVALPTIVAGNVTAGPPVNNAGSNSYLYEMVAWAATVSSANRLAIRQNIAAWYGITLS